MPKKKVPKFMIKYAEEENNKKVTYTLLGSDDAFIMPVGDTEWLAVRIDKSRYRFIDIARVIWIDLPL